MWKLLILYVGMCSELPCDMEAEFILDTLDECAIMGATVEQQLESAGRVAWRCVEVDK